MNPITQQEWDELLALIATREAEGKLAERKGRVNAYGCERCGGITAIARLADTGVTPFIVTCPRCHGNAQSRMYRDPGDWGDHVTHEFYRPATLEEANRLVAEEPGYRQHLLGGGLVFRDLRIARSGVKARGKHWGLRN